MASVLQEFHLILRPRNKSKINIVTRVLFLAAELWNILVGYAIGRDFHPGGTVSSDTITETIDQNSNTDVITTEEIAVSSADSSLFQSFWTGDFNAPTTRSHDVKHWDVSPASDSTSSRQLDTTSLLFRITSASSKSASARRVTVCVGTSSRRTPLVMTSPVWCQCCAPRAKHRRKSSGTCSITAGPTD